MWRSQHALHCQSLAAQGRGLEQAVQSPREGFQVENANGSYFQEKQNLKIQLRN